MLYPKMTESRMVFDLNGVWDFCLMDGEAKGEIVPMPVPSSYNDIYTGRGFADHVGNLYYRRTFTVSSRMLEKRLFLRFGSVTHKAEVWLNGTCLGKHSGGFLPFSFEITETAIAGENELEVIVNNIVDETTLPAGVWCIRSFRGCRKRFITFLILIFTIILELCVLSAFILLLNHTLKISVFTEKWTEAFTGM